MLRAPARICAADNFAQPQTAHPLIAATDPPSPNSTTDMPEQFRDASLPIVFPLAGIFGVDDFVQPASPASLYRWASSEL
jgi:hypothetical protein